MALILVCRTDNDLYGLLRHHRVAFEHFESVSKALATAASGDGLLILADDYPETLTSLDAAFYGFAARRGVRLYVEFPNVVPRHSAGEIREARWERAVVVSEAFAPAVPRRCILSLHRCRFVTIAADRPHLVLARVAGFDTAVYGVPAEASALLFEDPTGTLLVATTKLSQFLTGRYAPTAEWEAIWRWILRWACPESAFQPVSVMPTVRPTYSADASLPVDVEQQAFARGIAWFQRAKLFIHPSWAETAASRLETLPDGVGPGPARGWAVGDGSRGVIEGASSMIRPDGTQDWRYHVRNDCVGEVSMALAFAGALGALEEGGHIAANLNDFIYFDSVFAQGPRADPHSASYGLLSWTTKPPADGVYYGDDNARSMLGTMATSALLDTDRWTVPLLRCLLANLRTTGPQGFRGRRLEESELQAHGWYHFWTTPRIHHAPHYESWLWACYLWAYHHTGLELFLERAVTAIQMTMAAYPDAWHWTNGLQQERARMLLPLAWLVRVDAKPEHRAWLRLMAGELLKHQDTGGAIGEEVGASMYGAYGPPQTNEAYGTAEAPLIHRNGDPLCDLLYTGNFALVGLHEAAAATGDHLYAEAGDRLSAFLCRIQIRSERHPELDGGWFRAFDFGRWDYWASNADVGWGAWCIESGWTQAWITAVLAMRQMRTSLWALTADSQVGQHLGALLPVMMPDLFVC